MPKTYEGGCHCGRVRFRVTAGLDGVTYCNCSDLRQERFLASHRAAGEFRILSGESDLSTYTFNTGVAKHTFCKHCGIHSFYVPRSDPDKIDVNARYLDGIDLDNTDLETLRRGELGSGDREERAVALALSC